MFKSSSIYFTTSFVTIFLNFITLPLYTRYLSVSDYGIVGLFIISGIAVINLISFGLSQAVQRFYFRYSQLKFAVLNSSIITLLIIIFSAFFLLFYPISFLISNFIFNNEISQILLCVSYGSAIIVYFYEHNKNILIAEKKPYSVAGLIITQLLINFSVSIYCILELKLTYLSLIYGLMIANFIVLIISMILTRLHLRFSFSLNEIKKSFLYSYPESPNLVIGLLHNTFDRSMLTNLHGASSLGYYEFSFRFATILKVASDSFHNSWIPYFMEKSEEGGKKNFDEINYNLYQLFVILGFLAIGVSYFCVEALYILTTKEFFIAKFYIPLLVILYYISSFNFLSLRQIYFSGKLIYNIPISIIGISLNIIFNLILIPLYGVLGAIIATVFASLISSLVMLYFGYKVFDIGTNYTKLINIFVFTCFIILIIYPIMFFIENIIVAIFLKILILSSYIIIFQMFKFISLKKIISEFRILNNLIYNTNK